MIKEHMKIQHIFDRGSKPVSEDALVVSKKTFAVFDGAGSLNSYIDELGHTDGYLAANIAREVFEENNQPLTELIVIANKAIRDEMLKREIDMSQKINLWSAAVAAIRIHEKALEWVQLGDSLILLINNDNSIKLLVEDYDHDLETLVMWKKLAEEKRENIRDVLRDQVIKVRETMNVSYGILNGEDEMLEFLNSGSESLVGVKHILLFTDGLFIPKANPEDKDDFPMVVKLFGEGGLEKIKTYIRQLEKEDPKCWLYPRYKQYDDIAAIAISF